MSKKYCGIFMCVCFGVAMTMARTSAGATATLVGWNNLGMHCMDGSDFSVFSILPPYNSFDSQLILQGRLVTNARGITVTYEGVADPGGSINTSTKNKINFWQYAGPLYNAPGLAPDMGLAGFGMPGVLNQPQATAFTGSLFSAVGVPISPFDDALNVNYYPLMRLVARSNGTVLATSDIVLPVSDEMDCKSCHASGTVAAAMPAAGWVNTSPVYRDMKLNILRLHDERQAGSNAFHNALVQLGYNTNGLYLTVVSNGTPVTCAKCHKSNALAGLGIAGISPLTQAIHAHHANVTDPVSGLKLESSANRSTCYRCHPGGETRCLRGVMGRSVAPDGSMAMQCQSCHGSMSMVGAAGREGWLQEPTCQSCHSGTASHNNGQIQYTSVFVSSNQVRQAVDSTYATTPNVPAAGLSLYRFSTGHGNLRCAACHGSTHAEFATSEPNDNLQSTHIQGHVGMLAECTACHVTTPTTISGGPHGMHPTGQSWVSSHQNAADSNRTQCQACHGTDYRGTVLSRSSADRTLSTSFGTKNFWRGYQIGCYTCHNGPSGGGGSANTPATVLNLNLNANMNTPASIALSGTDPNGNALTYRIVSQGVFGNVGLQGATATYFPSTNFVGVDSFTYAANDGFTDSNLATVKVAVAGPFRGYDRTDIATFWPAGGTWSILHRADGSLIQENLGWAADMPVAGDYDGDGKIDIAVYYPAGGMWYIWQSSNNQLRAQNWGWSQAVPVPADYDGDGRTDIATYYPAGGMWYILQSSDGKLRAQNWGWSQAVPVPADYDGDGKVDIATYYPAAGTWYILQSSDGKVRQVNFGWSQALPVPADYDGDGKADIATYYPAGGMWYILQSSDGKVRGQNWGWSATAPVPYDFTGDHKADITVYYPPLGEWDILRSDNGQFQKINWGWSQAIPVKPAP